MSIPLDAGTDVRFDLGPVLLFQAERQGFAFAGESGLRTGDIDFGDPDEAVPEGGAGADLESVVQAADGRPESGVRYDGDRIAPRVE